jgi:hypothetical protein
MRREKGRYNRGGWEGVLTEGRARGGRNALVETIVEGDKGGHE